LASVIGLIPLVDREQDSLWMLNGYMDAIMETGGVPVMFPLITDKDAIEHLFSICDGIIFTGGHDISPSIYGEEKSEKCGEVITQRDILECELMTRAIDADKPILGICRGMQMLNALSGGTLYQDLPSQFKTDITHGQKPPYNIPIHDVKVEKDSLLYSIVGCDTLSVNSHHHQAIKDLSPKLKPAAYAADGIIEAVYMEDKKFVLALQWHPEFLYKNDNVSIKIFEAFMDAVKNK